MLKDVNIQWPQSTELYWLLCLFVCLFNQIQPQSTEMDNLYDRSRVERYNKRMSLQRIGRGNEAIMEYHGIMRGSKDCTL